MSAKEKALEIYNKYQNTAPALEANRKSKNHALIAVEYLIESTFSRAGSWEKWKIIPVIECTTEYWQEVKIELEKL